MKSFFFTKWFCEGCILHKNSFVKTFYFTQWFCEYFFVHKNDVFLKKETSHNPKKLIQIILCSHLYLSSFFRPKNGGLKKKTWKRPAAFKRPAAVKRPATAATVEPKEKNKRRQRQLNRHKVLKIKISQKKPKKKGLLRTKRSNQRQAASRTEKREQ